jgi:hypothetical protein
LLLNENGLRESEGLSFERDNDRHTLNQAWDKSSYSAQGCVRVCRSSL